MALSRQVEEILEALWLAAEEKRETDRASLIWSHPPQPLINGGEIEQALAEAEKARLLIRKGEVLALTEAGQALARNVVRRHRLAERLFHDVLDVGLEETETSACRFEHLLSPDATNSVCILLGHPTTCPHGKPIPEGECCQRQLEEARPLVIPATQLRSGEVATIAYLGSRGQERLSRIASLGILPGTKVELIQRHPSYVLRFGETTLALDEPIVREIYVRRSIPQPGPSPRQRHRWGWRL